MVGVLSGVVEYLEDRTEKSSTDDETSAQLVSFVKVVSIIFVGNPTLWGRKHRCAGWRVRWGLVM